MTKSSIRTKTRKTPGGASRIIEATRTFGVGLGTAWRWAKEPFRRRVFFFFAIIAGFSFLSLRVKARVVASPEYRFRRSRLRTAWPSFVSASMRKDFQHGEIETLNPFSRSDLPRFASDLRSRPWIESVEFVRWHFPARVELSFSIRMPYAKVEAGNQRHLVDAQGTILPESYYSDAAVDAMHLPTIRGLAAGAAVPMPGRVWDSQPLREGLALIDFLESNGFAEMVADAVVGVEYVGLASQSGGGLVFVPAGFPPISCGRSPASPGWKVTPEKLRSDLELVFRLARADREIYRHAAEIRLGLGEPRIVPQGG